jgi:hypothetical protein
LKPWEGDTSTITEEITENTMTWIKQAVNSSPKIKDVILESLGGNREAGLLGRFFRWLTARPRNAPRLLFLSWSSEMTTVLLVNLNFDRSGTWN